MKKIISIVLIVLAGCQSDGFYKAIEDIKDGNWYEKNEPTFIFEIKDKTEHFNLYYYIRNATQYQYSNIYISRYMTGPEKENYPMVRNSVNLFDATTGEPFGDGLGDLWDHKVLIAKDIQFNKVGKYTIKLRQYMRQDPLPYLMSVGISLEKIKK